MSFIMRWVVIGLAVLLLGGCDSVESIHQIGQPATEKQAKALEGGWRGIDEGRQGFTIKHIKANELCVAGLEWNDKDSRFHVQQLTVFLTTDRDVLYANLLEIGDDGKPKPGPARYEFARLALSSGGEALVIYPSNPGAFEKAVKDGTLKGTVKGDNGKTITIEGTKEQWDQFIDPLKVAEQFDVNHPMVLIRQSKPEKNENGVEKQ